jgi:hypothetical protein
MTLIAQVFELRGTTHNRANDAGGFIHMTNLAKHIVLVCRLKLKTEPPPGPCGRPADANPGMSGIDIANRDWSRQIVSPRHAHVTCKYNTYIRPVSLPYDNRPPTKANGSLALPCQAATTHSGLPESDSRIETSGRTRIQQSRRIIPERNCKPLAREENDSNCPALVPGRKPGGKCRLNF